MPRRTAAEAEQTRKTLLAVARDSFATQGYAATVTTAIATQAGVTRGALYHHFPDKTQLFRAVFSEVIAELDEHVARAALAESTAPAAFRAGCRACLEFMARPDYLQIASVDAPVVLGQAEWHRIDTEAGMRSMRLGLDALAEAGEVSVPVTDALVTALFGALTELGLAVCRGELTVDAAATSFETLVDRL